MPTKKDLQALVDSLTAELNKEYEAGVVAGRAAALDNLDALIEQKHNLNDHIAVAVLQWAKPQL